MSSPRLIQINLLPQEFRKTPPKTSPVLTSPITYGIIGLLVVSYLALWIVVGVKRRAVNRLQEQVNRLTPKQQETQGLLAETEQLERQVNALKLVGGRFALWSERLNSLSDHVPPGVWLTMVKLDPDQALTIRGNAVASEDELATIGKFMQSLQTNPSFAIFNTPKLEPITRERRGETELVQFTLIYPLRDEYRL